MQTIFRESETYRFIAGFIATLIYLLSLDSECYCTTQQCSFGIYPFIAGWIGMFYGGAGITWLANPFIIISIILTFRGSKYSKLFSFIATIICFSFLFFNEVIENEAGLSYPIISYKIGYWLWCSSALFLFICNLVFRKRLEVINDQF